jgi:tRNA nucleotidyltransferase (CCA-adding enzyme)
MVAAKKLYPDAVICPPGTVSRRVRDFLNHHGGDWDLQKPSKIPLDQVTLLVVVDTRARARIGPFAALVGRQDVEVHVYDHHPPTQDDIPADKMCYEPTGAAVTMIVERLAKIRARVTPEEATLFAMGIYDDTGALTYDATTDRDVVVLGWLRHMRADLSIVLSRVEAAIPANDRKVLDALAENAEDHYINGAKVVFSWAESEEYVEDIAMLIQKLRDYYDSHVTVVSVRSGGKTNLIVRSVPNIMNVKEFLAPYGGSGHLQAGSARLGNRAPREVLEETRAALSKTIEPLMKVESIMTSPVVAVPPDAQVDEAYRTMLRFGYQALPVVLRGAVLGIMTRKDLDKAHLHGFDRAKVGDFMTEGIISVTVDASVNEAHRLMATYSFERLPVLRDGKLVGIVTRADLVRALYPTYRNPGEKDTGGASLWMEQVGDLLESACGAETLKLLRRIGIRARELGMKTYLVGGTVRDILKGEKNIDLDISVEGDAETFIENWNEPDCRVTVHGHYKTGTIVFSNGAKVDIATARREFYEYAAAMPEVSSDSLKQDLGRRDFSVNAMAVSLGEEDWGTLIDFYGGRRDLRDGILRVLHNLSFVEDPSRLLRGVRLEQRLKMRFEDNTMRLLNSALRGGLLGRLSSPRVRTELEIDCMERAPKKLMIRMEELGIWEALFPGFRFGEGAAKKLGTLQKILPLARRAKIGFKGAEWLACMAAALSDCPPNVRSLVMDHLNFSLDERRTLTNCFSSLLSVKQFFSSKKTLRNSEVYLFLKNHSAISLLYCWAGLESRPARRWIARYASVLVPLKSILRGADFIKMGYSPGPWLGEQLEAIRLERMDGRIETREDELRYLQESITIRG